MPAPGGPFNNLWSYTQKCILKFSNFGGGYIQQNGPIHKIWHFSRFTACTTIGLSDERPMIYNMKQDLTFDFEHE